MTRKLYLNFKRLADILGSIAGLVIVSPLLLIIIISMKTTMPGPIFFKQERVGKNQKLFQVLKFRTMKVDKELERNFNSEKDNERITPLGRLLRRTKIDELPQLINVLVGDMSLVGPRPTLKNQINQYTAHQMERLKMTPGMTGLAQVNGNTSLPWEQRIEYDIEYINNFSLLLDLKILIKTIGIVSLGEEKFRKEKSIARGDAMAEFIANTDMHTVSNKIEINL